MPAAPTPAGQAAEERFAVLAIGTSAGGLRALSAILSGLDRDFPVPIVVVQHLDPSHPSSLAQILGRGTSLAVEESREGEAIAPGHVYIAAPDHHLQVNEDGTLSLTRTAPVRYVRPSADILFASVAASFGSRAIALVATGTGSDGAEGVRQIKRRGGTVLVQDEASSEFFGMPRAAIDTGDVDLVLPLSKIAGTLMALVSRGAAG